MIEPLSSSMTNKYEPEPAPSPKNASFATNFYDT